MPEEDLVVQLRADLAGDPQMHGLPESMDGVATSVHDWWRDNHLRWFTDHGPDHSRLVAKYALQLGDIPAIRADGDVKLTPLELYILYMAAWLHDVGMNDMRLSANTIDRMSDDDINHVRHGHPAQSKVLILEDPSRFALPSDDPPLIEAIALVACAHGTHYYKELVQALESFEFVRNRRIRGPLLAALLLMADELHLHYERARPLSGIAKLPDVSEAHIFKHRCITYSNPVIGKDGRIGAEVQLTFPAEMAAGDDWEDVQRWIVLKLQQQMGLVEQELQDGFRGRVRFDHAIKVTYGTPYAPRPSPSPRTLAIIRAEAKQMELIDHRQTLRQIMNAIEPGNVVIINGEWRPEDAWDVDGREDLLAAVAALCAARGAIVCTNDRLSILTNAEASDVLQPWLDKLSGDGGVSTFIASGNEELREPRFHQALLDGLIAIVSTIAAERVVLVASNLEGLTNEAREWLATTAVPALLSSRQDIVLVFSASLGTTLAAPGIAVVAVAAGSLDGADLFAYHSRFAEPDIALGDSQVQGRDYAGHKATAISRENVLYGQVTA